MRTSLRHLGAPLGTFPAALTVALSVGVVPASADPYGDSIPEAPARLAALPDPPLVAPG